MLTRSQLWQGLVLRARSPDKFVPGLQCAAEKISGNEFMRTIKAGQSSFRESVILYPDEKICTRTVAGPTQISAESITHIEEPEAGGEPAIRSAYQLVGLSSRARLAYSDALPTTGFLLRNANLVYALIPLST